MPPLTIANCVLPSSDFGASPYVPGNLGLLVVIGLSSVAVGEGSIPPSTVQRHCCLASPIVKGIYSRLELLSLLAYEARNSQHKFLCQS